MVLLMLIMVLAGLAMGTASPAANNACIELMPDRVATIVGIRGLFPTERRLHRIAIITLILHNVGDMALGFHIVFFGLSAISLLLIPTIFAMPRSCQVKPSPSMIRQI